MLGGPVSVLPDRNRPNGGAGAAAEHAVPSAGAAPASLCGGQGAGVGGQAVGCSGDGRDCQGAAGHPRGLAAHAERKCPCCLDKAELYTEAAPGVVGVRHKGRRYRLQPSKDFGVTAGPSSPQRSPRSMVPGGAEARRPYARPLVTARDKIRSLVRDTSGPRYDAWNTKPPSQCPCRWQDGLLCSTLRRRVPGRQLQALRYAGASDDHRQVGWATECSGPAERSRAVVLVERPLRPLPRDRGRPVPPGLLSGRLPDI